MTHDIEPCKLAPALSKNLIMRNTRKLIFPLMLILGMEGLWANYAFYRSVTSTCKSYRVATQDGEMYFGKEETTKEKFFLTVNSNRNNFEMALIVGFVAVGQAVKHQRSMVQKKIMERSAEPKTVHVSVNVPVTRDSMVITASATADQVVKLADGSIDSAEFMRLIKNSMVTL